ncbi:protein NLP1-like [Iris pallida]|uniref:Protein NLP1-like n=1 Tax=Iris pallida TaxID=29817 RepID=A0AAX6GM02_IRIPA|nr:protein NLP1-like [Iris pallida]
MVGQRIFRLDERSYVRRETRLVRRECSTDQTLAFEQVSSEHASWKPSTEASFTKQAASTVETQSLSFSSEWRLPRLPCGRTGSKSEPAADRGSGKQLSRH